jgi:hypothetical protein
MNLLKDFKTNYKLVECENYKISKKEKLIREINREIKEIEIRDNLDLIKITKKIKGKEIKVNENRFWKKYKDDNYILVTLKYKGVVIDLENKKMNYKLENDKNILINFLKDVIIYLEGINENDVIWEKVKIK